MTCENCLEAEASYPLPVCLQCYVNDQIGRAQMEDAKLGRCLGCLCKVPVNRAHCDQCEAELEEEPS